MEQSVLVHELKDIPLVTCILGVYSRTKSSNDILAFGLSAAEKGIGFALETILDKTGSGDLADSFAGNIVSNIKTTYPIVQKTPDKIYRKTKFRAIRFVQRNLKSALRSSVGKRFVSGFDCLTEKTESTYNRLGQNKRHKRARKLSKSENSIQTDLMLPQRASRGQQTKFQGTGDKWVDKLVKDDDRPPTVYSLSFYLLLPLEWFVHILRLVQSKLHALTDTPSERRKSTRKRVEHQPSIIPERLEEKETRRKVSPKKRLNGSIFRGIKSAAFKMLGFDSSCVKQTDIRQFLTCSKHRSLNETPVISGEDSEKKRKHDDILSDSEESSDDEDLVNMDLKNYVSEEDPDYEPSDEDATDITLSSSEDGEESDFDTVEMDGLVQIKDKENTVPAETNSDEKEKKPSEKTDDKKHSDKIDNTDKGRPKLSPRKALSPKKQINTNVTQVTFNKSPVKQLGVKDDKKESQHKASEHVKPSETGCKSGQVVQNLGGTDKSTSNIEKLGPKK